MAPKGLRIARSLDGLKILRVFKEPQGEGLTPGAEHREIAETPLHAGGLDVDEVLVSEVTPRSGKVKALRRFREDSHSLGRHSRHVQGIRWQWRPPHVFGVLRQHPLDLREVPGDREREAVIPKAADEVGTEFFIGNFEACRPIPSELPI